MCVCVCQLYRLCPLPSLEHAPSFQLYKMMVVLIFI